MGGDSCDWWSDPMGGDAPIPGGFLRGEIHIEIGASAGHFGRCHCSRREQAAGSAFILAAGRLDEAPGLRRDDRLVVGGQSASDPIEDGPKQLSNFERVSPRIAEDEGGRGRWSPS